MEKIRILIVDDHKMIRNGLCAMLESYRKTHDFMIDEAESGEEALLQIKKSVYDLIIMDYQLPGMDGAETTRAIVDYNPIANILALSNYDETMYIENILKAGAKGYVLKNIAADELVKAITTILNGKNYYSNEVAVKLIDRQMNVKESILLQSLSSCEKLSERELEILKLVAEEYTNKQIAEKLFISQRTVENHRYNMLEKMKVNNVIALLKKAREQRLL